MIPKLFISPSLEARVGEIEKILSKYNLTRNHPDLLYFEAESKLGIEQSRQIKEHFFKKPYSAEGRVVVLEDASTLTPEAQNALLKTFEEAPDKALIILGINSEQNLLPTILSRCEIIVLKRDPIPKGLPAGKAGNGSLDSEIEKLLGATIEERFEYIEKLKEREEFLKTFIIYWRSLLLKNPTKENKEFVKELLEAEKWANQNVNIRAILEYLMLKLPT